MLGLQCYLAQEEVPTPPQGYNNMMTQGDRVIGLEHVVVEESEEGG